MKSTTYSTPAEDPAVQAPDQSAPETAQVTGGLTVKETKRKKKQPVINRSCDEPILGAHGKPSRAARREANRVKRLQTEVAEIAKTSGVPQGLSLENRSAPVLTPMTGLHTVEERRDEHQRTRGEIIGKGVLPVGRPSEYTDEESDVLCAWVQAGGSLAAYSRETGRSVATVYRWMRENAGFQARYAQAHEDRADTLTDEMVEIADKAAENPTIEDVAAAKLRVETRKWIASKLRPQKWGDKQTVEHVGAVNIRIGIPSKPQLPPADIVDV